MDFVFSLETSVEVLVMKEAQMSGLVKTFLSKLKNLVNRFWNEQELCEITGAVVLLAYILVALNESQGHQTNGKT